MLDRFNERAASWSRRVVQTFCRRHFCGFNFSSKPPTPFFLESFGRAGGEGWLRSVVLRRGGRLRRPAAAAFRLPPPCLSLARACNLLAFFLAGNLLDAVRRWRSCADAVRRKNERRVCLLVGCSLFQRKLQYQKNLKLKCTNSSLAEAERSFSLLALSSLLPSGLCRRCLLCRRRASDQ